MSAPNLDKFAGRPFSFYPPIRGVEHNEWVFRNETWSEVLVANTQTPLEVWVPRRHLGEVSQIDKPVMIVGLKQELEYKGGALWPYQRRVIEIPSPGKLPSGGQTPPAPPKSSESPTEKKIGRFILASLLAGILATFIFVAFFRTRQLPDRITYETVLQQELGFTAEDNYHSVTRKLGRPAREHWKSEEGERQYLALDYPSLSLTLILMGPDRKEMSYIGAKDPNWKTVHSVELPSGVRSDSILRTLPRF
jgi:hypothetical protein